MFVYHNIRDLLCKRPSGALKINDTLFLQIYCCGTETELENLQVILKYAYGLEKFRESCAHMTERQISTAALRQEIMEAESTFNSCLQEHLRTDNSIERIKQFYIEINSIAQPHLFFYYFKLQTAAGASFYFNYGDDHSGNGVSALQAAQYGVNAEHKNAFAVNFYDPAFAGKSEIEGQIIYQIFPDRFKRDNNFDFAAMCSARPGVERRYHESWSEAVDYKGYDHQAYEATDFYGGNLDGIREKLPYLSALGVRYIYLNPIFKARTNHRYDAADYETIDELLGDEQAFKRLIKAADELNIGIILDLVINHCGADSIYFNRYGRYPSIGASQSENSPYHNWFYFKNWQPAQLNCESDCKLAADNFVAAPEAAALYQHKPMSSSVAYESWWGFSNLPTFNKDDLKWREFVYGPEGFIRKWLQAGISGYRIDVSDELPDDVLRDLYLAVKAEKADAFIIGEVWENPALQISYGHYRDFALGRTHDSFMGYPFRTNVLAFLRSEITAATLVNSLEELRDLLPEHIFYANMQLLSSHDRPRFITAVAADSIPREREAQSTHKLAPGARWHGERCLLLASLIQMFYPGSPSIYYGDEIATEGCYDPFNRGTFAWDKSDMCEKLQKELQLGHKIDPEALEPFKEKYGVEAVNLAVLNYQLKLLYRLRAEFKVLQDGALRFLYADDDKFSFERYYSSRGDNEKAAISVHEKEGTRYADKAFCAVNRSNSVWNFTYDGKEYSLDMWQGMAIIGSEVYCF